MLLAADVGWCVVHGRQLSADVIDLVLSEVSHMSDLSSAYFPENDFSLPVASLYFPIPIEDAMSILCPKEQDHERINCHKRSTVTDPTVLH